MNEMHNIYPCLQLLRDGTADVRTSSGRCGLQGYSLHLLDFDELAFVLALKLEAGREL